MISKKNILRAGFSTLLGVIIGLLTTAVGWIANGHFDWKTFTAGMLVAVVMAVTDILKEVKKGLDEDAEKARPHAQPQNTLPYNPSIAGQYEVWYVDEAGQYWFWTVAGYERWNKSERPARPPM